MTPHTLAAPLATLFSLVILHLDAVLAQSAPDNAKGTRDEGPLERGRCSAMSVSLTRTARLIPCVAAFAG